MSNSIKHVWACPDLSSRRGHRFVIAIMLLLVLRHPTCASCVPWMCCRMSNSIKHVWACPDLSFDRLVLHAFLHSLRSYFSPSRPLQLWFEAACETSFARNKHAMQSTTKSRRGRYCFICLSVCSVVLDETKNMSRAYGTGVGARRGHWFLIAIMLLLVLLHPTCASCVAWMCCRMSNSIKHVWACPDQSSRRGHRYLLQSCCCQCYVIQPVYHVLHECVVGCPLLSSMYEHVPINHCGVGIAIYCNHVVLGATSSNLSSCIPWMCCRMSNSIKQLLRACTDLSSRRGHWFVIAIHVVLNDTTTG